MGSTSIPTISRQDSSEAGSSGKTGSGGDAPATAHKGGILLNKTAGSSTVAHSAPAPATTASGSADATDPGGAGSNNGNGAHSPSSGAVTNSAPEHAACPSKIHFAPLPPAPERRHSISLGVASRCALLHSQGSTSGSSGGGRNNGNGVQWVAMTDEEWEAYKASYAERDRLASGQIGGSGGGPGEVPDLGTFVLQGGRKMLKKLRSLSSASSVSSSSATTSGSMEPSMAAAALSSTQAQSTGAGDAESHVGEKKNGGLLRIGRQGRNRSVSPAGLVSPGSSSSPSGTNTPTLGAGSTFKDASPDAIASRRGSAAGGTLGAPPSASAADDKDDPDNVVVIVRKSRPPSPAPVKHRSPPPSESSYTGSEDDGASSSGRETSASESESASDSESASEDDNDDDDNDDEGNGTDASQAVGPNRMFFHPPTPPYSGTATPVAHPGTRSRSASITIASLPSHPGRADADGFGAKEDERERAILGFVGGLERVALERGEADAAVDRP